MTSGNNRVRWYIALIVLLVFFETSLPYYFAQHNTPAGYCFNGQLAYVPDQDMYFSFISQARDGAFLLRNKLTATPHNPAFLNIEFWLVGFLQRLLGCTENTIYQLWRLLGAVLLGAGFSMLTFAMPWTNRRRIMALAAFMFTGGFGFLFVALQMVGLIGPDAFQNGIIDMRYGILPFQQMISNPHFSFPHGLILMAYACFILGERFRRRSYYWLSGCVFLVIGLVRPYDLIPPVVIFPLYSLIVERFSFSPRRHWLRLLPLFIMTPALLYSIWLFKMHPIFKYWSMQGLNASNMPSLFWHFAAFGMIGLLAIVRLVQQRGRSISNAAVFMLLWFGITFAFIQLGRYIPAIGWSPQIGVYLAAPLTLAAFDIDFEKLFRAPFIRRVSAASVVVAFVVSNVFVMAYFVRKFVGRVEPAVYYSSLGQVDALRWLSKHTHTGDVVLADGALSQKIAKYTPASVVASHYSVTPEYAKNATLVNRLLHDNLFVSGYKPLPAGLKVNFLCVRTQNVTNAGAPGPQLEEVFRNKDVIIFRLRQFAG